MNAVEIRIDRKFFPRLNGAGYLAISGVEFAVREGEFVCLIGPSGAGKTTTLNIIAGLDRDFQGKVCFKDTKARDSLAYLFQTPRLLPWRTLADNTRLPLKGRPDAERVAAAWLDRVGLQGFHKAFPGQASLGMQRRAALARAFALGPSIMLMDEPLVSLDEKSAGEIRSLLLDLWRAEGVSIIFVTHDLAEAARVATRVLVYSSPPARIVADVPVSADRRNGAELALRHELESLLGAS